MAPFCKVQRHATQAWFETRALAPLCHCLKIVTYAVATMTNSSSFLVNGQLQLLILQQCSIVSHLCLTCTFAASLLRVLHCVLVGWRCLMRATLTHTPKVAGGINRTSNSQAGIAHQELYELSCVLQLPEPRATQNECTQRLANHQKVPDCRHWGHIESSTNTRFNDACTSDLVGKYFVIGSSVRTSEHVYSLE